MEMMRVRSRAIAAVGYNPFSQRMKIRFRQGRTNYTFCGVPPSVYQGLLSAPSKGRYYTAHIRGYYPCR